MHKLARHMTNHLILVPQCLDKGLSSENRKMELINMSVTSPPSLRVNVHIGQSIHHMRLPRQGCVKEHSNFSGSTRILTIEIL